MKYLALVIRLSNGMFNGMLFPRDAMLLGAASMLSALGSRFVVAELTPQQEAVLRHPAVKRLVIACMFFIVTRDAATSLVLTVAVTMLLDGLANENSRFCVFFTRPPPFRMMRPHHPGHPGHPGHPVSTVEEGRRLAQQDQRVPVHDVARG